MSDHQIETLGDALPKQIERCSELIQIYNELPGNVGAFGALMIARDIAAAQKAIADGDVVAMLRAYDALKGCK